MWGEEVFLILDFQNSYLVLRLRTVFWQWAKSATNITPEMHFHKFHNFLEVSIIMEHLFCIFFLLNIHLYREFYVYIWVLLLSVIVIHFVKLPQIHDHVAVMKPHMERGVVCYETVFEIHLCLIGELWSFFVFYKFMFISDHSSADALPPWCLAVNLLSRNTFSPWFINVIIPIPYPHWWHPESLSLGRIWMREDHTIPNMTGNI